ncbi:MAG: hypothetical protein AAF942_12405 [Pseudomonadota bacterium]
MIEPKCWGIFRETSHSPGREDDDAAILRATASKLEARGFNVSLISAENAAEPLATREPRIFSMCEQHQVIDTLLKAEQDGAVIVNRPQSVINTYRHHTVELFGKADVPAPASRVVAADPRQAAPDTPVWVKRYDFHATQADDVLFADTSETWQKALKNFADRGIPFVIVQDHVPGDLIKFYGVHHPHVSAPSWFVWFYHRDQTLAHHVFEEGLLRDTASMAASALGVEIFGGDAIVGADGQPMIIDLNAWPSFALYRDDASNAIAEHLHWRFNRQAATAVG